MSVIDEVREEMATTSEGIENPHINYYGDLTIEAFTTWINNKSPERTRRLLIKMAACALLQAERLIKD